MLHGPTLKAVIWFLTIVGLTPGLLLALVALAFSALVGRAPSHRPASLPPEAVLVLRSNEYVSLQVGPVRIDDWHPRGWPAVALLVGASLVVVALVFRLHIPRQM